MSEQLHVVHHLELLIVDVHSLLLFNSEWHQGLCHAWWNDEKQWKSC